MNKTEIALKYKNALLVSPARGESSRAVATTFAAAMVQLGYMPSHSLFDAIKFMSSEQLETLYNEAIPALQKMKGADVKYKPMYPNFPSQVMEASDIELFINAMLHYWSLGHWTPTYETLPRELLNENVELIEIGTVNNIELNSIFTQLLSSNESISVTDKATVEWFLNSGEKLIYPEVIPFKENMAGVAKYLLNNSKDITPLIKTATDVLRVMVSLSDGDVSLAENTKFRSLKRSTRRTLITQLERVVNEEDLNRHRGQWVRAFHNLHVGEYSVKLYTIAKKLRENQKIETFNGNVQAYIDKKDVKGAVNLLKTRPSEFARRLDHLLRLTKTKNMIATNFLEVADQVPTRILLQLVGNLKVRANKRENRVVFPKGATQKAIVLDKELSPLGRNIVVRLMKGIIDVLITRFKTLDELGNVYIDPALRECPLPTQQRSASEGAFQVARGTRLPVGDKETLRFFIYWVGQDIDLSGTLHDEEFRMIKQISYTNLRSASYNAYHSGDITRAPDGASEFIDISIDDAINNGARYAVMNVLVYAGPAFADHYKCYAGWMTRESVNSGEVYEPKTVQQKVDLTVKSWNAIPVIFDLVERKAIWTDLATSRRNVWNNNDVMYYTGNNIHANKATIQQTLEAMVTLDNKVSLYELFLLHAKARGTVVENQEDADVVFSIDIGVTPYDIATINSEYVV